jgi:hypothetical protein
MEGAREGRREGTTPLHYSIYEAELTSYRVCVIVREVAGFYRHIVVVKEKEHHSCILNKEKKGAKV